MKTIAYVRVSTDAQDVTHQRLAILEFARTERLVVDAFLESQAFARHRLANHLLQKGIAWQNNPLVFQKRAVFQTWI